MKTLPFIKMHGIGNDFIVVDATDGSINADRAPELSRAINDRKHGVGGDGLILVMKGDRAPFRMRMFNPDGSEAEMCGNGIRCVAKYVRERGLTTLDPIPIETGAGLLELETKGTSEEVVNVRVNMGVARLLRGEIPMTGDPTAKASEFELEVPGARLVGTAVSMGNPHVVVFVEDVEAVPLETWGTAVESDPLFPQRTNVHFVQVLGRSEIRMRTWERGAGATLACGTGACASVVASFVTGRTERCALAHLPGGDLEIEYAEDGTVYMTGPAESVFEGRWPLS